MIIKFWGVRGSLPTPLTPREIEKKIREVLLAATADDVKDDQSVDRFIEKLPFDKRSTYGGNTPCVQIIPSDNKRFIVDAGSGIRELGIHFLDTPMGQGKGEVHLFLSHTHWDHIQGFPFFAPAFIPGNQLSVYNDKDQYRTFSDQQNARYFPVPLEYMRSKMVFRRIQPGQIFHVGETEICTLEMYHPGTSLAYRFTDKDCTFVYASDSEFNMRPRSEVREFEEFVSGADGMVFDSQFTFSESHEKVTWGHSSATIGVDVAVAAGVKRLLLFHHAPSYSDEKLTQLWKLAIKYKNLVAPRSDLEIITTYDGLEIDI